MRDQAQALPLPLLSLSPSSGARAIPGAPHLPCKPTISAGTLGKHLKPSSSFGLV